MKKHIDYNSEEIRAKFSAALAAAVEEVKNGFCRVSISNGNVKMGEIPSGSILPLLSCPDCCRHTCGPDCYAAKIANLRPSVLKAYARNMAILIYKPEIFWTAIDAACKMSRFFRFNVAGEILNNEYFRHVISTARNNPGTEILIFTKRYNIVNAWIAENGQLPENLHVLFSGWTNLEPENPYNLPETNVFDNENPPAEKWILCGGNCQTCACRGTGCWTVKNGETIAFKKH